MVGLLMLPRPAKSSQNAEKLKQTGPAEKKRVTSVSQSEQLASTPEPPLPKIKGTEQYVQITRSRRERVKIRESGILARERGIRVGAWGGKGELHSERR